MRSYPAGCLIMPSVHIANVIDRIEFDNFKNLRIFAQKKQALTWCTENNIKPARIIKLHTRFQESYALDMGHNCFLIDDNYTGGV